MKNQNFSNSPRCIFCNDFKELISEPPEASGLFFKRYICESCQAEHATTLNFIRCRICEIEAKTLKRLRDLEDNRLKLSARLVETVADEYVGA